MTLNLSSYSANKTSFSVSLFVLNVLLIDASILPAVFYLHACNCNFVPHQIQFTSAGK